MGLEIGRADFDRARTADAARAHGIRDEALPGPEIARHRGSARHHRGNSKEFVVSRDAQTARATGRIAVSEFCTTPRPEQRDASSAAKTSSRWPSSMPATNSMPARARRSKRTRRNALLAPPSYRAKARLHQAIASLRPASRFARSLRPAARAVPQRACGSA